MWAPLTQTLTRSDEEGNTGWVMKMGRVRSGKVRDPYQSESNMKNKEWLGGGAGEEGQLQRSTWQKKGAPTSIAGLLFPHGSDSLGVKLR